MSHIYIYSPSSAVRNKVAFRRGVSFLKAQGHEVEVDPSCLASSMRFAGDDVTRLAALHRAADSGADVALTSRGGYGLTRILPGIAFKRIAKAIERGTQFVGFSDFSALQLAMLAKTGTRTWAGPSICDDFGAEIESDGAPDIVMQSCFEDLLLGQGEGAGWRMSAKDTTTLQVRNATLWGGNLCVLTSLLGTPYFPDIKGGILFLEDVAEHPYRIERMLTQLLLSGVLAKQKAILLGRFTAYKLTDHDKGFKLQTVVDWLRTQTKTPILTNLPYGHVPTKVLLPMGAKVTLSAEGRDAMLFWGDAK
jgi:muramoyltetrapeptide carboxypeptidase